jgi:NADPH-dependent curcumin reductase CurA
MMESNRQWLLRRRPVGALSADDFGLHRTPVPAPSSLRDGELLLRHRMFVCAPTMRNWMQDSPNALHPTIPLNQPVLAPAGSEVIASRRPDLSAGARVTTFGSWQEYQVAGADHPVTLLSDDVSFVEALGVLGFNALTGYFGMMRVARPQPGDVVVVSGAAGSTGSIAAQVARIQGCRVIGVAGGPAKCSWLRNECRLDAAIDYRSEDVSRRLAQLCPDGIDVFFDNVGGDVLQAAVARMKKFGRIALCGQIAGYDSNGPVAGPRDMMRLIYGSVTMQGFLVGDYAGDWNAAREQLREWIAAGLIAHREDVRHGFEDLPQTFMSLFDGSHQGTLLAAL